MKSLNSRNAIAITRRLGGAALLLGLLSASYGCLDDVTLCDGSEDIRLAYRTGGGGMISPGHKLMSENGSSFLYVDGQCRYWAFPREDDGVSDNTWSEVATGELSAEQEAELKDELSVVEWQRWDQEGFQENPANDGGAATFWMPNTTFSCSGGCGSGERNEIHQNVRSWMGKLAKRGEPVRSDVRILAEVVPESVLRQNREHPVQPAPAGLDLGAHAFEAGDHYCAGNGVLVSGEAANTLRRYRREYAHGEHGAFWYSYLPIEAVDGQQYMVYMRDTTPLEAANGLVKLDGIRAEFCAQ
ncbi:hypothetical protein [Bradymonas sediminis]|uniref:Uncharacterized protein n=1 Tax=Bradymonas sediminis TaxID=1548548 RepID=A0A2Z4FHX2_9DELT|nr:hypothetical protein [Bradymonas sediminis]AWV88286.1 hypothetical protein DN745_02595 [Bradymonas sediminis]TDP77409.1 hypothetical protein DFR33_101311 [Bradymonas sediminis]